MKKVVLNEDEIDCLQELMNVAYGAASATIADILNAFVTLDVPVIKMIEMSELKPYLNENFGKDGEYFVATQLIAGDFNGEDLFVIDRASTINMARIFDTSHEDLDENDHIDILLEITNILSSSTMSSLMQSMESSVSFSPPHIKLIEQGKQFEENLLENYEQVIIISTDLNFENQQIKGQMIMLTTDDSILFIKNVLNKILEEL